MFPTPSPARARAAVIEDFFAVTGIPEGGMMRAHAEASVFGLTDEELQKYIIAYSDRLGRGADSAIAKGTPCPALSAKVLELLKIANRL